MKILRLLGYRGKRPAQDAPVESPRATSSYLPTFWPGQPEDSSFPDFVRRYADAYRKIHPYALYRGEDGTIRLLLELTRNISEQGPRYCGGLGVSLSRKSPEGQFYEARTTQMEGLPNMKTTFTEKDLVGPRLRSPV